MQLDPGTEQLISRCRAVAPEINDFFEEQRYIADVENIEEITPQYLLNTAVGLVQDQLESEGIYSNYSTEEILGSPIDLETMFYLAAKFDYNNYYRTLKSFDAQLLSEYNAMIENVNLPEDYLFEIAAFFNDLFPLDIGWEYINRGTDHWYSTDALIPHLVNIHKRIELNEDPTPVPIQEDQLDMIQKFLQVMIERENRVSLYVQYIQDKWHILDKSKLAKLVKAYDKDKLHPDKVLLFAKWNMLDEETKEEMGEPSFIKQHHLDNSHHIEHWEHHANSGELTHEIAVMIVISLVLDDLDKPKFLKELSRYEHIASADVLAFMHDLYEHVPWAQLTGGN